MTRPLNTPLSRASIGAIALSFAMLAVSFATRSSLGLAMQRLAVDLSWTRSDIASAGSISLLTMGVAVPVAGRAADMYGAARVLALGGAFLALALISLSLMSEYWQFVLGYATLGGIGYGLASLPVAGAMVASSAPRRQGLAMGIATSGTTAGQLLIIPLLAWMFDVAGWRFAFGSFALVAFAVGVFALTLHSNVARKTTTSTTAIGLSDLLRTKAFHGLFWSFLFCGFTSTGIVETHLIPFAEICGFSPVASSFAYSLFAFFNLIGMLGAGYLSDKVDRRRLLVTIYLIRAVAFVVPLFVGSDYTILLGFSVFVGVAFYATFPPTIGLSAAHFGRENVGFVVGLLTVGHSIGAAGGAFAGGYIYDLFMKYDWVWILSVVLASSSALLAMLIGDPKIRGANGHSTALPAEA